MAGIYRFHANVFARPRVPSATSVIPLRGQTLTELTGLEGQPLCFERLLEVTWDEMAGRLAAMPRMIFEPDGSWVWSGEDSRGHRWQVDGHLYELADQLHRVELHGSCPIGCCEQILSCFAMARSELVFELVEEGVTLDAENFLLWAAAEE